MTLRYPTLAGEGLEGVGANPTTILEEKEPINPMFMNRVILIGFTGKEAKHSTLPGGRSVTRLSLATTKRYKEGEQWKDKTQWHDCVVYGTTADYAANIAKGAHLAVEGELTYREFERTIETGSGPVKVQWPVTEIVVHSIKPLDRGSREDEPEEAA